MADDASARKLASIVAIDMAGYSRHAEADEAAAIKAVTALKARVTAAVLAHGGRVFNTAGDGFMLEFPTASGALGAAEEIARAGDPSVRVGVHLGEVSPTDSGDLLGHGVNVAARIQQMAAPGAVLVSGDVKRAIRGPLGERLRPQGSVKLDKMSETLPVFALAPAEGGRPRGRRLRLAAPLVVASAAVLVILAGFAAWFGRDALSRGASPTVLVAIPPIQAPPGDQALRAFADSLGDQVIGVMNANQVPTLPRADSQALRGPGAESAAQQLGVTLLLDASVQREAGTLSARARLDDVRRHVTLWSTSLDGTSGASEPLGRQVAATVTNVLLCANDFQRSPSAPTAPEVVALFFHACDLSTNMVESLERREGLLATLREVIRRAPRFAHARAWLANVQADRYRFMPTDQGPERRAEGTAEATRALELDPRDGEAYLALSLLSPVTDFQKREQLLLKGMAGAPSNGSLPWRYAQLLVEVGRIREANTFAQRAAAQEPLSAGPAAYAAYYEAAAGNLAQARTDVVKVQQSWPHAPEVWGTAFLIDDWAGDWPSVRKDLTAVGATDPQALGELRDCLAAQASPTPSNRATAEREAKAFTTGEQYALGLAIQCLSAIGSLDAAFEAANRWNPSVYAIDGAGIFFFPPTAAMRRDRRFMTLAARLGLVDYWRATGQWPDFCAEPGLPYDCKAEAAKVAGARHG